MQCCFTHVRVCLIFLHSGRIRLVHKKDIYSKKGIVFYKMQKAGTGCLIRRRTGHKSLARSKEQQQNLYMKRRH